MTRRDPSAMSNDEMTRETLERTRRIEERLLGDGSDDNPGLEKRVDRLESRSGIIGWIAGTALAAGIVACAEWVIRKIT